MEVVNSNSSSSVIIIAKNSLKFYFLSWIILYYELEVSMTAAKEAFGGTNAGGTCKGTVKLSEMLPEYYKERGWRSVRASGTRGTSYLLKPGL